MNLFFFLMSVKLLVQNKYKGGNKKWAGKKITDDIANYLIKKFKTAMSCSVLTYLFLKLQWHLLLEICLSTCDVSDPL